MMKRLSKKLSVLLVLTIILTSTLGMPFAMAEDVLEREESIGSIIDIQPPEQDVDVILLPEQPADEITIPTEDRDLTSARNSSVIGKQLDIDNAKISPLSPGTRQITGGEVDGAILVSGGVAIYSIDLPGGYYLQAQLDLPNNSNIDYDLYLLDSNFYIIDYVAYRTYINGNSGTLSEAVGYITSGALSTYYFYIESYVGASANETFTLSYAVSGRADTWEEDENARWAWPISFNFAGTTITGRDLNSFVDNEWFVFTVPSDAPYHALSLSVNTQSDNQHIVELYRNIGTSGTFQMAKQSLSSGSYNIIAGQTYYIRVFTPETLTSFDPNSILTYNLVISPKLTPTGIAITDIDGPSKAWINSYDGIYRWRIGAGTLTVSGVLYATINGVDYAVPSTSVTICYYNPQWEDLNNLDLAYKYTTGNTNSNGEFSIGFQMPVGVGAYAYYNGSLSIHYWDYVGIAAYATNFPSVYTDMVIYYLAYSILQ